MFNGKQFCGFGTRRKSIEYSPNSDLFKDTGFNSAKPSIVNFDDDGDPGSSVSAGSNISKKFMANDDQFSSLLERDQRTDGIQTFQLSEIPMSSSSSFNANRLRLSMTRMGGLFRKKRHSPTLGDAMESGEENTAVKIAGSGHSSIAAEGRTKLLNNDQRNNTAHNTSSTNSGEGGVNVGETNTLIFGRLNNGLRDKQTTSSKPLCTWENSDDQEFPLDVDVTNSSAPILSPISSHSPSNTDTVALATNIDSTMVTDEMNAMDESELGDTDSNRSFCDTGMDSSTSASISTGTKYKLLKESQVQVCRLNHPRNLFGKLVGSKLLRRWESHTLILDEDDIHSKTPSGYMERPIKYANIEDLSLVPWNATGDKFCVRIQIPEGSVLLQTKRAYTRNQWFHSINWQRSLFRFRRVVESTCNRPEVLLKELKSMVEQVQSTPLQGGNLNLKPVQLACTLLQQINAGKWPKSMAERVLNCVAPILDTIAVISEISKWINKHCNDFPRSRIIVGTFADIAQLTLKKNMDFGKYTSARGFVQEFIFALSVQNDGVERVKNFVRSAHGTSSACPHPRILPNLVSVCLAAIHALYDSNSSVFSTANSSISQVDEQTVPDQQPQHQNQQQLDSSTAPIRLARMASMNSLMCYQSSLSSDSIMDVNRRYSITSSPSSLSMSSAAVDPHQQRPAYSARSKLEDTAIRRLSCLAAVFETMSEFEDWRLPLASLLQPVPFPDDIIAQEEFAIPISRLVRRIGTDYRCDVHLAVLGMREGKEGWFHLVCPGGPVCVDDGDLYATLLKTLLHCCCRRKKFLRSLNAMLGPLQLLALRECESAMEALCRMLEMEVVEGEDLKLQMITALQSTPAGKRHYAALCERQIALRELQQKGGPRKLTLPSKSTDADLAVLLSSGSFGNLEWLSLAFTNVTSTCAECLIKLPSLRYLNLWSTQFSDVGLQMISEHLHKLQVLNLCETPVTDKGLCSLTALTNLRKLNLNSTQLSARTFHLLRAKLPALQEVDVRYTDAWCADEFLAWP